MRCDAIVWSSRPRLDSVATYSFRRKRWKKRDRLDRSEETRAQGKRGWVEGETVPLEREKRGKDAWVGTLGAKNRNCSGLQRCCGGCPATGAVLNTAKYGIVVWIPARDLAMLWVWVQSGGACVRSAGVEVNYRVTTRWRWRCDIAGEEETSAKSPR